MFSCDNVLDTDRKRGIGRNEFWLGPPFGRSISDRLARVDRSQSLGVTTGFHYDRFLCRPPEAPLVYKMCHTLIYHFKAFATWPVTKPRSRNSRLLVHTQPRPGVDSSRSFYSYGCLSKYASSLPLAMPEKV